MKTPKGWRRLKRETVLRDGDRYVCWRSGVWISTMSAGAVVGVNQGFGYIRRIKRKARK